MNTDYIKSEAVRIERLSRELDVMRKQRSALGTGPKACKEVVVKVYFKEQPDQCFKMDQGRDSLAPLMPSKDMMALALVKAWNAMIDNHERELAKAVAKLVDLTRGTHA